MRRPIEDGAKTFQESACISLRRIAEVLEKMNAKFGSNAQVQTRKTSFRVQEGAESEGQEASSRDNDVREKEGEKR